MPKADDTPSLLAAVVYCSGQAIFGKALDTIVTSWNRGAERIYGYTAAEIVGQPVSTLVPADRPNEIQFIMDKIKRGETLEHYETVRKRKDGQLIDVAITVSPVFDARGKVVGAATMASDITARRIAEEALRASEKLAAMGRMAASVAHEMRDPLDVAKNLAYLLQQNPSLDSQAREFVALLDAQLTHVVEICTRTLSFARSGDAPVHVSISAILDEVLTLAHRTLSARGIAVQRRFQTTGDIVGHPGPLRQICVNLIANAIDAIPAGQAGCIVVRVRDSRDPLTHAEGVRFTVSDNGSGIRPQHLPKLFQPFFSTKKEHGTGLGLWVTSGIVTQHGGSIRVRTQLEGPARGTTFSVFLPKLGLREKHKDSQAA